MFIILLKFSTNKSQASEFMAGHREWLKKGFEDGVFLLAGSLEPDLGGGILADSTTLPDLEERVKSDPFVAQNIVSSEILELSPGRTSEQLKFLVKE